MMVSVDARTTALAAIRASEAFAINYIAASQTKTLAAFEPGSQLLAAARFAPDEWTELQTGSLILKDAVGAIDCSLEEIIERDSTYILLGRVAAFSDAGSQDPLVSFQGRKYRLA